MNERNDMGMFVPNPDSYMSRVISCLEEGMADRKAIAVKLGITNNQVAYAIRNLWAKGRLEKVESGKGLGRGKGQLESTYAPKPKKPFAGVSFIFGQL